ncbi:MAG: hypothetical protein A2V67_11080 [Deltaproteobacteria bacterium RBG_13_61_14]|nr:MAG: hypothetical protein A2V67_11080 [Deltaproteobacteria bacterium RBG_13_61_14]
MENQEGQYREVLNSNPLHLASLRGLEDLYRREERWEELAAILLQEAEALEQPEERAGLIYESARIQEERLGQTDAALQTYARVEGAAEWEQLARRARRRILQQRQDWEELRGLLEIALDQASPAEAPALRLELARLFAFRLGQPEAAEALLAQSLEQDPGHWTTLVLLAHLRLQRGQWPELVEVYTRAAEQAAAAGDQALELALRYRLGQLLEFRQGDRDQALAAYARARELDAGFLALLALCEISDAQDDPAQSAAFRQELTQALGEFDPDLQKLWRFQRGLLLLELQNQPDAARAELEKVVELDPKFLPGALALERLYRAAGSDQDRVRICQTLAAAISDPRWKVEYAGEKARLLLDGLGDAEAAAAAAEETLALDPQSLTALKIRQTVEARQENWPGLFELVDQEITQANDPRELQGLYFWRAELAIHRLSKPELGLDSFRQALEIPPSQFPALKGMERLYRELKDWPNLLRVLTAENKLAQEAVYKKYYLCWSGVLWEEVAGRDDLAFAAYSELIKADPGHPGAFRGLARICAKRQAWEQLLAVLGRAAQSTQDPALQHALLYETAAVLERRLHNAKETLARLEKVQQFLPEDRLAGLELSRIFYREGQLEPYREIVAAGMDRLEHPGLRAAAYLRAGSVSEAVLGDLAGAGDLYQKALLLANRSAACLPALELAEMQNDWPGYLELLRNLAERCQNPARFALLWHGVCLQSEQRLDEQWTSPQALSQAWQELYGLDSQNLLGLRGLADLEEAKGDWAALEALLEQEAKLLGGGDALALRLRLAELRAERLNNPAGAIADYRALLHAQKGHLSSIRALERLFEQTGNWADLIRALLQEIPLRKDPDLGIALYTRVAGIYEDKFKAVEEAIKSFRAILRIKPDHLPSLHELQRLYESAGRWQELVSMLNAEIGVIQEVEAKIALYERAAIVWDENLEQADQAIGTLRAALELDPARIATLHRMQALFEREGRFPDWIDALEKEIALTRDPQGLVKLHRRVGTLWDEKLDDPGRAIESWIKVRDLAPEDETGLRALERLFDRQSRWSELIDTLERLAAITIEASVLVDFYSRIGALSDQKLEQSANAVASWRRVLELEPAWVPALEALESLYTRTQDGPNLVETKIKLAEAVVQDQERAVRLYCEVGSIQENRFQDDNKALISYARAMEIDSRSLRPIHAARAVEERHEDWKEVIELWSREEKLTPEPDRKKEIFFTIGGLHGNRLQDLNQAAVAYEAALKIDGRYLPAVKPLAEIYYAAQAWEKARPLFEIWSEHTEGESKEKIGEIYYQQGWVAEQLTDVDAAIAKYIQSAELRADYLPPHRRLADLFYKQEKWKEADTYLDRLLPLVRAAGETAETLETLKRLGGVEVKLEKTDSAIIRYQQVLEIAPADYPALEALVALLCRLRDWNRVLPIYDQLIRCAPTPPLVAKSLVDKGAILEDQLKQADPALAHYRKAVEVDGDYLPGWERLSQNFVKRKAWQDAVTCYDRLLKLEKDKTKLVEHNYRLGKIFQEGFNDLDRARSYYEAALALNERHIPAMEAIGSIYLKQKAWDKYLDLTHRFVKMIPAAEQMKAVPLYLKMGEVYRDQINNKEKAILEFQAAVKIDPEGEEARAALANLYLSDKNFYPNAIKENLILLKQRPFRIQSYRDLGKIFEGQNRLDEVFCVYSVLNLFKDMISVERMFFDAHKPQVVKESKRGINPEAREKLLVHHDERGALRDLLVYAGDYLDDIFPPELEKLGARKSAKVDAKSTSPQKKLFDEIALNLGIETYDLYLLPGGVIEPRVVNTSPPGVIVGLDYMNRFKTEERRFIIGRLLEHAEGRHALALNFPLKQVAQTLMAMAKLFKPEIVVPGLNEADSEKLMKTVKRAVPRKYRKQLEDAAVAFASEGGPRDLAAWRDAMNHTANRAGLLVCNDLNAAIAALLKTQPKTSNLRFEDLADPIPILQQSPEVEELIQFVISDAYFTLRKRAGFSLLSI